MWTVSIRNSLVNVILMLVRRTGKILLLRAAELLLPVFRIRCGKIPLSLSSRTRPWIIISWQEWVPCGSVGWSRRDRR